MRLSRTSNTVRALVTTTTSLALLTGLVHVGAPGAAAEVTTIDGVTSGTPELVNTSSVTYERGRKGATTHLGQAVTFTLEVPTRLQLDEVRLLLRNPALPGDSRDAGRQYDVTIKGSRTFATSPTVPDGTWTAAALWNNDGRWNSGPKTTFTVVGGVLQETATATAAAPTTAPTTTPTTAPTTTPTTAPTTAPTAAPSPSAPAPTTAPAPSPTAAPAPTTTPSAPAPAFTPIRSGGFEDGFTGWDFGGPSVLPNPGGSVVRDTSRAYEGSASAKAVIPSGSGNKYARTLWGGYPGQSGDLNLGEGADFSYGMALYLPPGFHSSMQSYFVPMRWDNYGVANVSRGGLAMYSDGTFRLFRERAGVENQVNLLGSTTFRLAEGQWHWLEVRQKLSSRDGSAVNEVRVNDQLIGSSTARNYYGEPVGVIRYGIVAIADGAQTNPLTIHYDRAVIGTGRLGRLG
jgi:hypothetical protein